MGLSICRSIIDAHGGHLWAEPIDLGRNLSIHSAGSSAIPGSHSRGLRIREPTEASFEMLVNHRLAQISDHPIAQGAVPVNLIRICGDVNCRDRRPASTEMPLQLSAVIPGLTSATNAVSARNGTTNFCPRKRFDRVAQQPHEFLMDSRRAGHRSTIEINVRFGIAARGILAPIGAPQTPRACLATCNVGPGSRQSNAAARKPGSSLGFIA